MITGLKVKNYGGLFASIFLLAACGGATGNLSQSGTGGAGGGDTGNDSGSITISNIYSQPKQLGVGDVLFTDLNGSNSLDFEGVDPNAEFVFGMVNASGNGNYQVAMSGDVAVEPEFDLAKAAYMEGEAEPFQQEISLGINDMTENFHQFLREQEKQLEDLELPPSVGDDFSTGKSGGEPPASANLSANVSLGHRRTFKVLSGLNSTRDTVEVSATAECIGNNVLFYVDEEVPADIFSDADIGALCDTFDPIVVEEQNLFGAMSDVDGNGRVIVLYTPQVNRLGSLGGGIITGFFLANDLHPNSSSNPASNYGEILYVMVPDPNGRWGARVSREFCMSNLCPSVLPHELQHVINYNQKVFAYRGQAENSCLNEALSHMAESLMGQGQENPSRYGIYLRSPQSYSIVSCSSAGLGNRGGSFLMLQYLYEQADNGPEFLRRLIQSNLTGIQNLEAAFAGRANDFDQFGEFFLRFAVAVTGITRDPRFSFKARERDPDTSQWHGAAVVGEAEDGRGSRLNGVSTTPFRGSMNSAVRPAAVRYFKMSRIQGELAFRNGSGGAGYGVLIRTK